MNKTTQRRPCPQGVAAWPWNQWPDHRGTGGRMFMESVAGSPWNQWPDAARIRSLVYLSIKRSFLDGSKRGLYHWPMLSRSAKIPFHFSMV